ncbi:MAG: hypothetical protein IKA05_00495, partial [Clostridia bacterium]|nr:hypothetical protein [Clostridia bacterium]
RKSIPTHNMKKKKKQSYGAEQMLKILLEYFLLKLVREYYYNENIEENLPRSVAEYSHAGPHQRSHRGLRHLS